MRSADERLSILELTRCHAVVGQSPGRRVDHLSGRRDRYGASTERARRTPARRIAQVGSQKRNRSSRAWSGDQTKHGNRKYDIEIRYCHFVSRTYSQMYDGRARARTADTHAHRTTRTKLNCRTKHEHSCGNCAQNRHTHQMQRAILRMGLSLGPRGSKSRPNAKCRQAEDRSRTCRLDACERGKWG